MRRPVRKRRQVAALPQVPTAWTLEGPTSRKLEPAEQVASNMMRPPPPQAVEPPSFEPAYMVVKLTQISKKQYMDASKSENITARRPLGFIVGGVDVRMLYINEEDEYYAGVIDTPYYTDRMFTERETTGVEKITRIVFTKIKR